MPTGSLDDVELIDREAGALLDDQGYVQQTYSGEAWLGYELDSDGNRTGRKIAYAGNNGAGESWYTKAATLEEAMKDIDEEWVSGLWLENEMSCDPRSQLGTSIYGRFRKCMAVCACEGHFRRPAEALMRLEVRGAAPYTLRFACVLA